MVFEVEGDYEASARRDKVHTTLMKQRQCFITSFQSAKIVYDAAWRRNDLLS